MLDILLRKLHKKSKEAYVLLFGNFIFTQSFAFVTYHGNSELGVQVWRLIRQLICLRHLLPSTAVTILKLILKKNLFSSQVCYNLSKFFLYKKNIISTRYFYICFSRKTRNYRHRVNRRDKKIIIHPEISTSTETITGKEISTGTEKKYKSTDQ